MADENKRPLFGANRGESGGESDDKPKTTDAAANATATTTPDAGGEGRPAAEVTDAEAASLQGAAAPNRTPAFGKRDFEDENVQLTDTDDLQSLKTGAAAASAAPEVDMAGIEAVALAGAEGQDGKVQFTSSPISALRVGPYQFENGVLVLDEGEQVEKFEKLLKQTSIRTQQVVRKIDRSAGEAVARRFLEQNGGKRVRGGDVSSNATPAPTPRTDA